MRGWIAHNLTFRIMISLALSMVLCSCRDEDQPEPPKAGRNVLLILVDTLRWDHIGCYGAARDTSPAIDRLAADAVRFDRAYAASSWTIPSVASIITGLFPSRHTAIGFERCLPDEVDTLAEILKREGYATAAVISNKAIDRRHNFHQGFDVYLESQARGHDYISTDGVTRQAIQQLGKLATGVKPFFLLVHYFDPHYNYKRHAEYGFAAPSCGRLSGDERMFDLRRMNALSSAEVQFLRDLYDEEIRFTDAGIGRLLDRLRELQLYDQTLIIFTADHGEGFLDHGTLGHTSSLYDEIVRVPLIIRRPRLNIQADVVRECVSLVSLTPTILDLLNVDASRLAFQADSFQPLLVGERTDAPAAVFCEVDYEPVRKGRQVPKTHKKAIIVKRHKLIRDDLTGKVEVYDLSVDAHESNDLHRQQPKLAARLLTALERSMVLAKSGAVRSQQMSLSEEDIKSLKSLGYVGGAQEGAESFDQSDHSHSTTSTSKPTQ